MTRAADGAPAAIIIPSVEVDQLLELSVRTCRQLYPSAEIVALVDDDHGAERIADLAQVVATGPMTIGAKRNLGATHTVAPHLAFIDSDAYPEPGWIENAVAHLKTDPSIGAVGGPNVSPPQETWGERCVGLAHHSPLVCGWWTYRKSRTSPAKDVPNLPSCNLVVRRSDYEALDGMHEDLFTAEDTDFCRRLGLAGRRVRFEPDVVVIHKNRSMKSFVVQRYTFGVAMVPLVSQGTTPDMSYSLVSLLPAGLVAFLAGGAVTAFLPKWRRPWAVVAGAYGALVLVEATRHARRVDEVPGTAAALLVGNLAPGVGILLRAAGFSTDLRGIYRNDR